MVFTPNKVVNNCCHEQYGDLDQTRLCLLDCLSYFSRSLGENCFHFKIAYVVQHLKVSECKCFRKAPGVGLNVGFITSWNKFTNYLARMCPDTAQTQQGSVCWVRVLFFTIINVLVHWCAMSWLISGSIVVDGHELHEEDLRLMYTFNQASGSAAQYEAHSDSQVCLNFLECSLHFQK